MALGIPKGDVYYGIGGFGTVGPLVATNPENGEQAFMGFQPLWNLQIGLRSVLLGQEPIIGGLPIPSIFPTAQEVEFVVARLLEELQQMRDAQNVVPKLEAGRK
jgi:hypothetical protein